MKKTILKGLIAIVFLLNFNTLKAEKLVEIANSNKIEFSTEKSVELNNIIISENLEIDNNAYEDAQESLSHKDEDKNCTVTVTINLGFIKVSWEKKYEC